MKNNFFDRSNFGVQRGDVLLKGEGKNNSYVVADRFVFAFVGHQDNVSTCVRQIVAVDRHVKINQNAQEI